MGLAVVETFIASGNVIFQTPAGKPASPAILEQKIEKQLLASFGYEVATFLRTDAEVEAIARYKPFEDKLLKSAQALNIAFLARPLPVESMSALQKLRTEMDEFHAHGREIYWLCRQKQSESKFSNVVLERTLKVKATFRGFNTVAKLAAKYPP